MSINNMSSIVFVVVSTLIILFLNPECRNVIWNILLRCLSGLVLIYIINYGIAYFGGNIDVKINEISASVAGIFGVSGVIGLYALQLFFTIS